MPLLQMFLTVVMLMAFITVVFMIAWYVAVPLFILWAVLGGIRWLQNWFMMQREQRAANGCSIRRTHAKVKPKATVIDVDYTEVR